MAISTPTLIGVSGPASSVSSLTIPLSGSAAQSTPTDASMVFIIVAHTASTGITADATDDSPGGTGYSGPNHMQTFPAGHLYPGFGGVASSIPPPFSGVYSFVYYIGNPLTSANTITVTLSATCDYAEAWAVAMDGMGVTGDCGVDTFVQIARCYDGGVSPNDVTELAADVATGGTCGFGPDPTMQAIAPGATMAVAIAMQVAEPSGGLSWNNGSVTTIASVTDAGTDNVSFIFGYLPITPPVAPTDTFDFSWTPVTPPTPGENAIGAVSFFEPNPGPTYCPPAAAAPVFNHRFRALD